MSARDNGTKSQLSKPFSRSRQGEAGHTAAGATDLAASAADRRVLASKRGAVRLSLYVALLLAIGIAGLYYNELLGTWIVAARRPYGPESALVGVSFLRLTGWTLFGSVALVLAAGVGLVLYSIPLASRPLRGQAALMLRQREALASLDAMFRDLFERSLNPVLIFDAETRQIRRVNQHAIDLFGYDAQRTLELRYEDLIDKTDLDRAMAHFERARGGVPQNFCEQKLIRRDGKTIDTEMNLSWLNVAQPPLLLAVCRDISERRQQEQEIQQLVQRFVVLNEVSADLATIRDSTRLCELLSKHVATLIPCDGLRVDLFDKAADTLTPIFLTGETRENGAAMDVAAQIGRPRRVDECGAERLVVRDRQYILVGSDSDRVALGLKPESHSEDLGTRPGGRASTLIAPMTLGADIIGLIQASCSRLSAYSLFHLELLSNIANVAALAMRNAQLFEELTRTLGQIRDSEALLSSLISQSPIALWIGSPDGRTVLANAPAALMLGRSSNEALNEGFNVLNDEQFQEQGVKDDLYRVAGGEVSQRELVRRNHGGESRYRATFFPLRDAEGAIINAVALFEDITNTRALEAQLLQAQKMESIGTLAGGIAHDFNNLLTGVLGYTSFMLERLKPGDQFYRELKHVERSAQRAAELTEQLLAFSRKSVTHAAPINLNRVARETMRILQRSLRHEIELRSNFEPELSLVEADATQMQQVLLNLCLNSRDAMPQGGLLTIETANETIGEDRARRLADVSPGDYVRLGVIDTGTGIPSEYIDRIFDPFFTTKEVGQGSGLGLAMAYGIITSLKGFITVQSEVNKGTTFHLWLPKCEGKEEAEPSETRKHGDVSGNETILVVDDEKHILRLAEACLPPHGYHVMTASSGPQALEMYAAAGGKIELVLLDLLMPGIKGAEVWELIQQEYPDARVLFSSGYADSKGALVKGMEQFNFIRKPYRIDELLWAIRKTLDGQKIKIT